MFFLERFLNFIFSCWLLSLTTNFFIFKLLYDFIIAKMLGKVLKAMSSDNRMRCTGFETKCLQSLTHEARAVDAEGPFRRLVRTKRLDFPVLGYFNVPEAVPLERTSDDISVLQFMCRFYLNCIVHCWCIATNDIFDNLFSLQTKRKLRHGNLILKYRRSTLKTNLQRNLAAERMHCTRNDEIERQSSWHNVPLLSLCVRESCATRENGKSRKVCC